MNYKPNKSETALFKVLAKLKTETGIKLFLRDLLTENELKEFANRWKVAQMLSDKTDYKQIIKETNMSSTTVARISKWLNDGMGGYKLALKQSK